MRRSWMVLALLCLAVTAGSASAAGKGSSMFSIGLGQGVADGYAPATVGASTYLAATTAPETNAGVEYWYSFSDDYAMALSGAYGFSSMKWEGATAGDPEIKATGTSIKVRVGGDRMGKVGDRLVVFMGPGIEYWTGKQKARGQRHGERVKVGESVWRVGADRRLHDAHGEGGDPGPGGTYVRIRLCQGRGQDHLDAEQLQCILGTHPRVLA